MAVARTVAPLFAEPLGQYQTASLQSEVRTLGADQLGLFQDHLLRLAPSCRQDRFSMEAGDRFIRQYVNTTRALSTSIVAHLENGVVRGTAELRPMAGHRVAEIALSVEKPWRRRGLGTVLLRRIIGEAQDQRVRLIYFRFLAGNLAMKGLAAKFTTDMTLDDMDVVGQIDPRLDVPKTANQPSSMGWVRQIYSAFWN
ncbi:GNAT family N-acetyltransferase [Roseibium sediminis]|uniref:GNAT family N-acetyltransferase n=1 Tax=Roseibium sediminis TaxID=1775174 RepID=UPI00313BC270